MLSENLHICSNLAYLANSLGQSLHICSYFALCFIAGGACCYSAIVSYPCSMLSCFHALCPMLSCSHALMPHALMLHALVLPCPMLSCFHALCYMPNAPMPQCPNAPMLHAFVLPCYMPNAPTPCLILSCLNCTHDLVRSYKLAESDTLRKIPRSRTVEIRGDSIPFCILHT
ncbi:hypothetical protein D3C78_1114450 [compost metagenome]